MADWPPNGDTDWNTKMLAYLAVSHNTDGTQKTGFQDRGDPAATDFSKGDLTIDTAWHDLDLSSIITDTNATSVLITVNVTNNGAGRTIRLRKNGNSNTIAVGTIRTQVAGLTNEQVFTIPVASRIIEYNVQNAGTWSAIEITVIGWWI